MPIQSFTETQPFNFGATIVAADALALKTLLPAGIGYRSVDQILVTNSDVIGHAIDVVLMVNGVNLNIGSVTVPPGAGFNGVSNADLISQLAQNGPSLQALEPSTLLKVGAEVAVTLANALDFVLLGASL